MKNLFKIILCIFCLSFTAKLVAQECDFDVKDKDKFTGKTKVSYWYQLGYDILYIWKLDNKVTVQITSYTSGAMQKGVAKGSVGQIRLDDGEMVTFTANADFEPVVTVNAAKTDYKSSITAQYDLPAAELAKMAASAPAALKVQMGSEEVVKEFAPKKAAKIKIAARCLYDYKD